MEENTVVERTEEKSGKVVKIIVVVLAVLGLVTAVGVVLGYFYKKFRKTIAAFNEEIVSDPLEEEDLTDTRGKGIEEHKAGCSVNLSEQAED